MRASLGFRAGPLYVGTGNLLKTKRRRRQHSGVEIMVYLIVAPFIIAYFTAVLLWILAGAAWGGSIQLAKRTRQPHPATTTAPEPEDDPTWTPAR